MIWEIRFPHKGRICDTRPGQVGCSAGAQVTRKMRKVKRAHSSGQRKATVPEEVHACPAFPWVLCWVSQKVEWNADASSVVRRKYQELAGVSLLVVAATAQCLRGTALLWGSTFHSVFSGSYFCKGIPLWKENCGIKLGTGTHGREVFRKRIHLVYLGKACNKCIAGFLCLCRATFLDLNYSSVSTT